MHVFVIVIQTQTHEGHRNMDILSMITTMSHVQEVISTPIDTHKHGWTQSSTVLWQHNYNWHGIKSFNLHRGLVYSLCVIDSMLVNVILFLTVQGATLVTLQSMGRGLRL